jgi:hypothetical protein
MGDLRQSFDKTNLDLTDSGPLGFNTTDTITSYPATNTGTPTNQANPGPSKNFTQQFTPSSTYLNLTTNKYSPLLHLGRNNDYDVFDATNLDINKPGVDGGIPYKKDKDPTVYPVTTQRKTPISGYNATAGQGATKFDQKFGPTNTYLDYIK